MGNYLPKGRSSTSVVFGDFMYGGKTTGTTLNTLTKFTGAPSTAVIASTTDTDGVVGVAVAGAGTTGNVELQVNGLVVCIFDGATTAGDYVQYSSTTGGDCHDAGATRPTSGSNVVGKVLSTNASAGSYVIDFYGPGFQAASAGGGTTTNALTLNNSNSGAASGATFNGSAAVTLSANTLDV